MSALIVVPLVNGAPVNDLLWSHDAANACIGDRNAPTSAAESSAASKKCAQRHRKSLAEAPCGPVTKEIVSHLVDIRFNP